METLLSSDLCALLFDSTDGSLVGVRDLERKTRLAASAAPGCPPLAVDGRAPAFAGLALSSSWGGASLRASFEFDGLRLDLLITLGARSACSSWALEVRNPGRERREVLLDFPLFHGTGTRIFAGGPRCPVPWIALADPSGRAGLGVVVKQPGAGLPEFSDEGGTARARLGPTVVQPGRRLRAAEARVLVSGPDWRPTARECAAWLGRSTVPVPPLGPGLTPDELLALHVSFPGAALTADDPVDASLAGLPCRRGAEAADKDPLARSWACGCASAIAALQAGGILPDPPVSDPGIVTRMFRGPGMEAVVCARLSEPGEEGALAGFHAPYEVRVPVREGSIPEVALCDLEDASWQRLVPIIREGYFSFDSSSNWVLCLVLGPKLRLAAIDSLPETAPGGMAVVRVLPLAGSGSADRVLLRAPGLRAPVPVAIGSEVRIPVPLDAHPGWHPVWIDGRRVPRFMRFLHVLG
jgi:hypothetical protein